ncbi:hypothetical protein LTR47_004900 [Exophiala xenobiotica]|nr:hypothetical protein LTR47_004900 [Exophiala xenobiotica]KAK5242465.1 hypothetical protein LTS06_011505 [Exophiala xenobiotica]KAK5351832.1 hypothetical protein LTR61_005182 [Exophiala xenobiotica]KAK5380302.1 hypothetical protein LTR11_003931 [Exophiala xenobiotica]KAK5390634.1 hypothetical protein LTS03_000004 [Exophiala xenobiotica]
MAEMVNALGESNLNQTINDLAELCPHDGTTLSSGPFSTFRLTPVDCPVPDPGPGSESPPNLAHLERAGFVDLDVVSPLLFLSPAEEMAPSSPGFRAAELEFDSWNLVDLDFDDSASVNHDAFVAQAISDREPSATLPLMMSAPDDFSWEIPSDVRFLLDHFAEQYVDIVSLIKNQKSPWRILHLPSALSTFGELVIWRTPDHFRVSLFYAILALSAFHLDRLSGTDHGAGHLWTVGTSHYMRARSELRKGLALKANGTKPAKYKDILVALLTMVTVCITSGTMEDARAYLLQAEMLIRRRGLPKPRKSRKVKILHSIFVFLRVIEESTYIHPESQRRVSYEAAKSASSKRYPSLDLHVITGTQTVDSLQIITWDNLAEADLEPDGRSVFTMVYGMPETLFVLMSHITCLANEVRQNKRTSSGVDPLMLQDLEKRIKIVEELLCNFNATSSSTGVVPQGHFGSDPLLENLSGMFDGSEVMDHPETGQDEAPRSNHVAVVMDHMIRATQSALLIYFYRQVRDVNPRILQPLVKEVKDHLLACENYKTVHGIASSSLVWPGFVAAIEAHDENDFLDLSACLRGCGERSGLRNFDRAAAIAADMRSERLAMAQSCTPNWRDVLQDKHIPLVCS